MSIHELINFELKKLKKGGVTLFFKELGKGEEDIYNNHKYKEKL